MAFYSPFDKELSRLEGEDLVALKNATEGWYIEYKREVPDASSVAKSISAFANTYGGWLFYGIVEESKENSVAGSFPGIPRSQVDAVLQRIRLAVAEQVQPSPHFDTKVIWGPCSQIDLEPDFAIICIQIPWSPNTPHVHKTGRIYRRISDGSEPKPECDRFILDRLWQRSEPICTSYKEWINRDPEFLKIERERPYIRLLITPDLWDEKDIYIGDDESAIRSVFQAATGVVTGIPFDTVYTYSNGYIARQLAGNDPQHLGLTWRLRSNLVSDIYIPLTYYNDGAISGLLYDLYKYENAEKFIKILNRFGYESVRVMDLNYLFNIMSGIVDKLEALFGVANCNGEFYAKFKLLNVSRYTPFVDVTSILDKFERHGPPMCLDSIVIAPDGMHPNTFTRVSYQNKMDDARFDILIKAFILFMPIAKSFGVAIAMDELADHSDDYVIALQAAGLRAVENHEFNRKRRSALKGNA